MEVLKEWDIKLQLVKTKKGSLLYRIYIDDNWFFLEQNPLKNSKYGYAYRILKERYPEFYMFWEIKNNTYTRQLLVGLILPKKATDIFIKKLLSEEESLEFDRLEDRSEDETKERLEEIK